MRRAGRRHATVASLCCGILIGGLCTLFLVLLNRRDTPFKYVGFGVAVTLVTGGLEALDAYRLRVFLGAFFATMLLGVVVIYAIWLLLS